jgi:hypothetical protein
MPFKIVYVGKDKYKVCKKDNKQECYSKKGIPEINAIKQMKAIGISKGLQGMPKQPRLTGLGGSIIPDVEYNSISDTELKFYLPNVVIKTYPELENIKNIEELLPENHSYFILLYLDTPNSGHWTCLKRFNNDINYFCSYGTYPDKQMNWYGKELRKQLGEDKLYLTKLLNKTDLKVNYNDIEYQNDDNLDIVTCGRHCINFIKSKKDLKEYYKMMKKLKKESGKTYDEIVSEIIDVILD